MVIFLDSMATVVGLTFMISQIIWTTGSNDFVIVAVMKGCYILRAFPESRLSLQGVAP
jgi:hypothetical protein